VEVTPRKASDVEPAPTSLRATVARGAATGLVLRITSTGLGLLSALVLAHLLGVSGYGAYVWAFAWVSALAVPAMLGIDQLVVREVAIAATRGEWGAAGALLRRGRLMVVAVAVALAAGVGLVALLWRPHDSGLFTTLMIALPLLPFVALLGVQQGALQALRRFTAALAPGTVIRQAGFLTLIGVAILVTGSNLSSEWAMGLQGVATVAAWAAGAVLLFRALPAAASQRTVTSPSVFAGGALAMGMTASVLVLDAQVGVLVLGARGDPGQAGIYAAASQLTAVFALLLTALRIPLAPVLAELHASSQAERLQRALTLTTRWAAVACGVAAVPLLVLAGPLLSLFGHAFENGAGALRLLVAANVLNGIAAFNGLTLLMTGRQRAAGWAAGLALGVDFALCLVLVPVWGTKGAATGALAAVGLRNALNSWQTRRLLGLRSTAFAPSPSSQL
jgi:O-antigen/teichoic acid export membrane protein